MLRHGLHWRRTAQREKLNYVAGAANRFMTGLGYGGKPAIKPSWLDNKATYEAVIKEMDSFYQDEVNNIYLPYIYAFEYSEMKLAGATKQELRDYLNRSRQILGHSWSASPLTPPG